MTTTEEISALTEPHHPEDWADVDSVAVDTVRVLAADAVQKVGNGHPGTAMSLAPLAYTLFQRQMRHDPSDVHWLGRDRFILSCGHSSLTLYIQLYLGGFGLELEDIESLRTWKSKTPGHPEFRHTKGVEITTGPLGQGLASAVGMAMAARYERGLFDPDAPDDRLGTFALTRLLAHQLDLPVIAAGGIMDGAGIAAALKLGAAAAQLGTAFIACDESLADEAYRAALASDAAHHTVMTRAVSGRLARCLANRFTALGADIPARVIPAYPIAYDLGKALHAAGKARGESGYGAQWAGQGAPLARAMPTAQLVARLAAELDEANRG
mgnify:CR=1 FL=1